MTLNSFFMTNALLINHDIYNRLQVVFIDGEHRETFTSRTILRGESPLTPEVFKRAATICCALKPHDFVRLYNWLVSREDLSQWASLCSEVFNEVYVSLSEIKGVFES